MACGLCVPKPRQDTGKQFLRLSKHCKPDSLYIHLTRKGCTPLAGPLEPPTRKTYRHIGDHCCCCVRRRETEPTCHKLTQPTRIMIAATEVPADSPCSPLEATLAEQQQQDVASRDSAVAVLQSDGALLAAAGLGIAGGQHVTPKHNSNSSEGQRLPAPVQPAGNGCLQMADADFMMFRCKTQPCNKVK